MSGFATVANQLLKATLQPGAKVAASVTERLNDIEILANSGFSKEHVFRDLRELYNDCTDDEKTIKLAIGKLMVQVHGMLNKEETVKVAPTIVLNIQGDNMRINAMLCPGINA